VTRRQFACAAAPASLVYPGHAAQGASTLVTEVARLQLRHTWTTTMSSSNHRDVLRLRYTSGGVTGQGEGAPIVRYKEDAVAARAALDAISSSITSADPWKFSKLLDTVFSRLPGQWAAKAALDMALHDWVGQKLGVPLYRYLGLDPDAAPITSFSIGIDTPEVTRRKVQEAAAFPLLKIKVGLDTDEATMEAVRSVTRKTLRVDANEGWKTKEEAVRKINWLESQGVDLVEQPLPAHQIDDMRWVRGKVHIPVIADEASLHPADIPKLAGAFDGINIKLMKCGGIQEALRMIHVARSVGLKVMLGCMIESSIGITAAAHIAPLVDYVDLDGNLLISNDPVRGVTVRQGKLVLPSRPGLGLTPA